MKTQWRRVREDEEEKRRSSIKVDDQRPGGAAGRKVAFDFAAASRACA